MNHPLLIGISGGKGEGKDTVAAIICERFPFVSVRIAFADALKREVSNALGVSLMDIETSKHVFRPMLQWFGTEFRRQYCGNPKYWIEQLDASVRRYDGSIVVIPDVRFPNEYEYVKAHEGIMVKVTRDIFRDKFSEHASETSLKDYKFDFTLVNNGTLDQLHQSAELVIEQIKRKL